jgi:hypothetical protein
MSGPNEESNPLINESINQVTIDLERDSRRSELQKEDGKFGFYE